MENAGILQRLVLALGDTEKNNFCSFTKIVAGWADKVADIFNQQQTRPTKAHFSQMPIDHAGIQVARTSGDDLANWKTVARQPLSIIIGLHVPSKHRDRLGSGQRSQSFLE